jgi:hypothetical protein
MLADQVSIKGIKFNFQMLLNGWVLSAVLWCVGTGLLSISTDIADGCIPRIGGYIIYAGWGWGGGTLLVFIFLMCKYWWVRRSGKIL